MEKIMEIQINIQNKKAKIIIDVPVEEVDSIVKKLMNSNVFTQRQMNGKKGGLARAKNISKEKMSDIAKMGAKAMHKKKKLTFKQRSEVAKLSEKKRWEKIKQESGDSNE